MHSALGGRHGGKSDMERVGLFSELGYTTIGDRYSLPNSKPFNVEAYKGKQMLLEGTKTRSALQTGYFDTGFKRIMESEAYSEPVKLRRRQRLREATKNIGQAFVPSSGTKKPSGACSHYGTFAGPVEAFSPVVAKPLNKATPAGRNIFTVPPKRGTGYGYVNVAIGGNIKYVMEPYEMAREHRKTDQVQHRSKCMGSAFHLNMHPRALFDLNPYHTDRPLAPHRDRPESKRHVTPFRPSNPPKKVGGMKAGTFDPYPTHSNELYGVKVRKPAAVVNNSGKIFQPSPGPKSTATKSIIQYSICRSVNRNNFRSWMLV